MSESAWSGYPPIEERDAEIERLRTDRDAIGFAAAEQIAAKDAEIERLRGLLRECLPYVAAPTGSGGDIWRRVREALGE
jgi:hypothetical protein